MPETNPSAAPPPAVSSMPARDLAEVPVVARARAGDAEAFRVIFESHAPAVRRFLADVFRDASRADEGTQETFVRAHARLGSLRDGEKLLGWLLGIARMVSLEHLRSARRERPSLAAESEGDAAVRVDRAPTPEAALLSREAEGVLDGALATLEADRRAALLLRLDHGLPYGEIAEAMGWTLQKVKNEIHRARLQLRAELSGYLEARP